MKNIKRRTAANFDEALRIVVDSAHRLGTERVSIYDNCALNRILAEDIVADDDQPPVNKSLKDGFACYREDLADKLKVIEAIPAGTLPKKAIKQNECARIMTGAILPDLSSRELAPDGKAQNTHKIDLGELCRIAAEHSPLRQSAISFG